MLIAAARNRPEAVPKTDSVRQRKEEETVPHRLRSPLSTCSAAPAACRHSVRIEALSNAHLFAELPVAELSTLERLVSAPGYVAGERIYRVGDQAGSLFIVASGAVKLVRPSPRGDNAVVSVLGPGDTFGTLTRIERCGETAVTMVDSCIIGIPVRVVRSVLERHPKVAMAVFDELADRLEQSYQALEQLSVGSADKRVAAALLNLSEKLGRQTPGGIELSIPLSRADLGAIARITPESASRALGRLHAVGAVDFGRQWTSIIDPALLHDIATS